MLLTSDVQFGFFLSHITLHIFVLDIFLFYSMKNISLYLSRFVQLIINFHHFTDEFLFSVSGKALSLTESSDADSKYCYQYKYFKSFNIYNLKFVLSHNAILILTNFIEIIVLSDAICIGFRKLDSYWQQSFTEYTVKYDLAPQRVSSSQNFQKDRND